MVLWGGFGQIMRDQLYLLRYVGSLEYEWQSARVLGNPPVLRLVALVYCERCAGAWCVDVLWWVWWCFGGGCDGVLVVGVVVFWWWVWGGFGGGCRVVLVVGVVLL
jgi:hypothetical protein